MILGDRIRERITVCGSSQAKLARALGVTPQAVSKWVVGGTTDTSRLYQMARALQTTPEYLTGESDDPSTKGLLESHEDFHGMTVLGADTVELEEFDVSFGMGTSYIHDLPVHGRKRVFSRSWIRLFTDSPFDALFWASGNGTSMMPAILEHDILLIDTQQRTPRMWDQFWAIDMHGMGMIKALRPGKEGAMRILSINPDWPEDVAYDGEMNVIGRVVAIVRKV